MDKVGGDTDKERMDNAFDAMHEFYMFVVNGVGQNYLCITM